jgi:hypothetical protein
MKTTNPYTTPFIDVSPLDNYIAKREPPPLPPAESKVIHMILTVVGVIFMLLAIAVGKVVSKDVTNRLLKNPVVSWSGWHSEGIRKKQG